MDIFKTTAISAHKIADFVVTLNPESKYAHFISSTPKISPQFSLLSGIHLSPFYFWVFEAKSNNFTSCIWFPSHHLSAKQFWWYFVSEDHRSLRGVLTRGCVAVFLLSRYEFKNTNLWKRKHCLSIRVIFIVETFNHRRFSLTYETFLYCLVVFDLIPRPVLRVMCTRPITWLEDWGRN